MVLSGTMQAKSPSSPCEPATDTANRILEAAYAVFTERGYAGATSLAIATRARVSKRSLYEIFGNKAGLVAALIGGRTAHMVAPDDMPPPCSGAALAAALRGFGERLLPVLTQLSTITIIRLAMLEAERAPELARLLDERGRQPVRRAARNLLQGAAAAGLVPEARVEAMLQVYFDVLQGDVMMALLLGLRGPPDATEVTSLAAAATEAALALCLIA